MGSSSLRIEATLLSTIVASPKERKMAVGRFILLGQYCRITRLAEKIGLTLARLRSADIKVTRLGHACPRTAPRFEYRLSVKSLGRVGRVPDGVWQSGFTTIIC